MSNPAIAKAKEVISSLSYAPRGKEYARRRQLAFDGYRIELAAAREEGFAEGRAEVVRVLRTVVIDLAEDLGVELDEARRDEIDRASLAELEALLDRIRRERRW